jgi:hypothetical protein
VKLLSATEASKLLGIPAPTVRTWYHRRERTGLYAIEYDKRGAPRFAEAELIRLRDRRVRLVPGSSDFVVGTLDRLLSARDAERVLHIPASTVNTWHHRRLQTGLFSRAVDTHRSPLFYESDLIALRAGHPIRNADGSRIYATVDEDVEE